MPSNEELGRKLAQWRDYVNTQCETLAARMKAECESFLESPAANPKQIKNARIVLTRLAVIDKSSDCTEPIVAEALLAGMAYESMRVAGMEGPNATGRGRGIHWLGTWVELTPLEKRIANYLLAHASRDGVTISLYNLSPACWGERYAPERREKYAKTLSLLFGKLNRNEPQIPATCSVRGDDVIVDLG